MTKQCLNIQPVFRDWRAIMQGIVNGSGGEWSGKSGDKSHAVQTLRVDRAAPYFAPAFGLRVLQHRFARHGNDASLLNSRHSHFGLRVKDAALIRNTMTTVQAKTARILFAVRSCATVVAASAAPCSSVVKTCFVLRSLRSLRFAISAPLREKTFAGKRIGWRTRRFGGIYIK